MRSSWREWQNSLFLRIGAFFFLLLSSPSTEGLLAKEVMEHPPLLQVGVGIFNVHRVKKRQVQAQIEYKWRPPVYTLRPLIGVMATQKESVYVYGGVGLDLFINHRLVVTPSFAPGIYYRGHGKNLGYPLEFRSSLEVAAVFKTQARFGLQFYHISNASLGHKNPGEESLVLFLSIPWR
jgi:lipid A 3-O-deacylase